VEAVLRGFLDGVLPVARRKGVAVIAMKVLGAGHYVFPEQGITAEVLIRFALSQEVAVVIAGCSIKKEVQTLANAGRAWSLFPSRSRSGLSTSSVPMPGSWPIIAVSFD